MTDVRGNQNRVEIFKGTDDDWYYRFVAANNEPMDVSEGHANRQDAIKAAVTSHGVGIPYFEPAYDESGDWIILDVTDIAGNGEDG